MNYLSEKQILLIHSILIDETGGSHGIRDINRVKSAVSAAKLPIYKTTFEKAAVYLRGIVQDHPFIDGNKRTGVTSAMVFLQLNKLMLSFEPTEIEDFAVDVAVKNLGIEEIVIWLKDHTLI